MSAIDPTVVQQKPTATEDSTDVGRAVVDYLASPGGPSPTLPEVAADHESRIAFGEKKYGQRLKINNGRNAAMDAYQELLDYLSYGMQAYLETGDTFYLNTFNIVASIADEVRQRLQ
jgi:hypothetical protein